LSNTEVLKKKFHFRKSTVPCFLNLDTQGSKAAESEGPKEDTATKTSLMQNSFSKTTIASSHVKHRSIILSKNQIKFQGLISTPLTNSSKIAP
jgi:hypothetical protein